eukprot:4641397-Pyramimonas_sp.AAC.1
MCLECEEPKRHLKCSRCGQELLRVEFSRAEQCMDEPTCKSCKASQRKEEKAQAEAEKRAACSKCGESKTKAEFSRYTLDHADGASVVCTTCVDAAAAERDAQSRKYLKTCARCGKRQRREFFSGRMWANVADQDRKCMRCVEEARVQRGCWKCIGCKDVFPKVDFCRWLAKRATKISDGKQRCNQCFENEERKRKEVADRSWES